jgi:hypothetical protein
MEDPYTDDATGFSFSAYTGMGILFSCKNHHVSISWSGRISGKNNQESYTVD